MLSRSLSLAVLLAASACVTTSRGDLVRLANGGQLRRDVESEDASASVRIRNDTGAVVEIGRESVDAIERRSPEAEENGIRARTVPHTVEDHWASAEWCRAQRLTSQQQEQLDALLEIV